MTNRMTNVYLTCNKAIPNVLSIGKTYLSTHLEDRDKSDTVYFWIEKTDNGNGQWISEKYFDVTKSPSREDDEVGPDGKVSMPIELPLPLIKELAAQRLVQILEEIVKKDPHGNM